MCEPLPAVMGPIFFMSQSLPLTRANDLGGVQDYSFVVK